MEMDGFGEFKGERLMLNQHVMDSFDVSVRFDSNVSTWNIQSLVAGDGMLTGKVIIDDFNLYAVDVLFDGFFFGHYTAICSRFIGA